VPIARRSDCTGVAEAVMMRKATSA
jgi:hypothetical protein